MDRDQFAEHLRFASELGVAGVSRDPAWRVRSGPLGRDAADGLQTDSSGHGLQGVRLLASLPPEEALANLRSFIGDCTRCKLHGLGKSQVVFRIGNASAGLMFVGEAPGADEDVQGFRSLAALASC